MAALRRSGTAFVRALLASVAVFVWPLLAQGADAPPGQAPSQVTYPGTILYLNRGGIWQMNLATLQRQPFVEVQGATVTHVSHSWDQQRIAYSTSVRGAGFALLDSSIVVAAADGTGPRTVVHEAGTGSTVEWPAWSPDGSRLAYTKTHFASGVQRVEEVDLATEGRTLVAEAGSSPAYSADGASIVFASPVGRTWSIWQSSRAGGSEPTVVVSDLGFLDVDYPLYARGGEFVAFIAAGPGPARPADAQPTGHWRPGWSLYSTSAHDFHGALFDLWAVQADGSGLRRAAELRSEEPHIAWSPDGRHQASWGRLGLQIVDITGQSGTGYSVTWVTALAGSGPSAGATSSIPFLAGLQWRLPHLEECKCLSYSTITSSPSVTRRSRPASSAASSASRSPV